MSWKPKPSSPCAISSVSHLFSGSQRCSVQNWSSARMNPIPTSQRPHCTGDGHTKPILKEVNNQVLLGLWTCRVFLGTQSQSVPLPCLIATPPPFKETPFELGTTHNSAPSVQVSKVSSLESSSAAPKSSGSDTRTCPRVSACYLIWRAERSSESHD